MGPAGPPRGWGAVPDNFARVNFTFFPKLLVPTQTLNIFSITKSASPSFFHPITTHIFLRQKACQPLPLKLAQPVGHAHLVEGPSCCCGCNCLPWKLLETNGKQQEEEKEEEERRMPSSSSSDDAGSDYQVADGDDGRVRRMVGGRTVAARAGSHHHCGCRQSQSYPQHPPGRVRLKRRRQIAPGKMEMLCKISALFCPLLLMLLTLALPATFANNNTAASTTTTASANVRTQPLENPDRDVAELLDVLLEERVGINKVVKRRRIRLDQKRVPSYSSSTTSSSSSEEDDMEDKLALQRTARRVIVKQQKKPKFLVDTAHPIHMLFPLPAEEGRKTENPFGITILKARPVVDEGIEEVYRRQLAPINSLITHFNDTQMSDAHGPNVAINMLVENRVDVIIGYAFVYALAPVARMSPYWHDKDSNGIPVITSIGLTTNLDNRNDYKFMTRISSPYKIVKDSLLALYSRMHWSKTAYVFHDERHDSERSSSIPYGECYLLMSSLQSHLYHLTRMEHNHFMFNELKHDRHKIGHTLQKASMLSNGERAGRVPATAAVAGRPFCKFFFCCFPSIPSGEKCAKMNELLMRMNEM
uniref:Receptor ligand binding region domain-containing protein n=1 Tax=Globodera rostochiensis TaxID=31243 RepID=A0A914HLY5_GLORO